MAEELRWKKHSENRYSIEAFGGIIYASWRDRHTRDKEEKIVDYFLLRIDDEGVYLATFNTRSNDATMVTGFSDGDKLVRVGTLLREASGLPKDKIPILEKIINQIDGELDA